MKKGKLQLKNSIRAGITLLLFMFFSCHSTDPAGYMEWINNRENGLFIEQEYNGYLFGLQYKPLEYVTLLEARDIHILKDTFEILKKKFNGMQYFTLKISANKGRTDLISHLKKQDMIKEIEYLRQQFQYDIKLADGKDTLTCSLFHMEYIEGLTPWSNFIIAFDSNPNARISDKTLIINTNMLGFKQISMTIKSENIKKIPNLKIS